MVFIFLKNVRQNRRRGGEREEVETIRGLKILK